ncbi:MAG: hypothetical protein PHI06_00220 [Desulfobulbaceae bacterium]|nr:hypothetical protein [Desulfobulbaceae bacterium]
MANPTLPIAARSTGNGLANGKNLPKRVMRQLAVVFLACLFFLPLSGKSHAEVLDAPHNTAGGVFCQSCHSYSLWWRYSPSNSAPDRANLIELLCAACHGANGTAPRAVTHSSGALGSLHRADISPWGRSCLDCHDPHFQLQLREWVNDPTVPDTELYLAQGTISAITNNGSTIQYTLNQSKTKAAWSNPAGWTNKTAPGRGLLLVVSTNGLENTYKITAAIENSQTPGTGTISVQGTIAASFVDKGFGLIYGQLIKKQVAVDPDRDGVFTPVDVKFFDGKGGFIDNDAADGINGVCQVCHSQTLHFVSDVTPDPHIDVYGAANATTLQCTICHSHKVAFGHGSDGGSGCAECHTNQRDNGNGTFTYSKHEEHLALEIKCSACHDPINIRDTAGNVVLKDGEHVATTVVCANCHHDGTDLSPADGNNPPNVGNNLPDLTLQALKAGWQGAQPYPIGCDGCHNVPPTYESGSPKANSHQTHKNSGYTCDNCHYATTTDGISLIGAGPAPGSGAHTNNSYDISPKPGLSLSYDPETHTCSNISVGCHGGSNATWGTKLGCSDCHLATADLDDFSTNQTLAKVSSTQWMTTGHGRPATEPTPYDELTTGDGLGNPGAGLSCEYCHDKNVGHYNEANPMRLANFSTATPNNVCWVCHKTGSTGYDPDAAGSLPSINSLAADKVDSYHEFLPGAGGQFCWDCHDPHGDSNLKMVHDKVAKKSDINTGKTLELSPPVVFTDRGNGNNGYASTSAPFTGICNVCHSVQLRYGHPFHYTNTSGDEHGKNDPEGRKCTDCHTHTSVLDQQSGAVNEKAAFSEGTCLNCHNTSQASTHATPRRAISPEFPAQTETNGSAHGHFGKDLDFIDCRVCHDVTDHMSGQIVLIDGDWNVLYRGAKVNDLEAINTNEHQFDDISDFCMSCHDADGATRLPNPKDPFANGNAPPDVATRFKGSLNVAEKYGDMGMGSEGTKRMVLSHHPLSRDDQNKTGAKLECTNCHGAHSASASQKLANPHNTSSAWTGTINNFCLSCHAGGDDPRHPNFPVGVTGPQKNWIHPPGSNCDADNNPTTIDVYDCMDKCVSKDLADSFKVDNYCDDGYAYGPYVPMDLRCDAFDNDNNKCGTLVLNSGYSILAGIDQCTSYSQAPWHVDMSWSNSPHGGGTKRTWPGYVQTPQIPSYELDCIVCHDPHGSYTLDNPIGNPYMIRDFVDGTPFVDDGSRRWSDQVLGCSDPAASPPDCTHGSRGPVIIDGPSHNGDPQQFSGWTSFCSKCHVNWAKATSSGAHLIGSGYNSCLTCHAHGAKMGNDDYGGGNNAIWCP